MWDFFLNKFMKTSYASPVQWRFKKASHLDDRNSRISSSDEVAALSMMASLGVCPYCRTRKHDWSLFSRVLCELISEPKQRRTRYQRKHYLKRLFVLLFGITLTRLISTEMANCPVTKLVGVTLKLRKLNEKFAVMRSCSQQNLEFGHFTLMFSRGWQRNVTKSKTRVQNCCFCSLNLLFCGVLTAVAVLIAWHKK